MEIWKQIDGYESLYWVSNLGKVRNREKTLKPTLNKKGYERVGLYKNGVLKTVYIHRLVAEAFIPNPSNFPQVNHIDENKQNNNADNLQWCTASFNNRYGNKNIRSNETKLKNGRCPYLARKIRLKSRIKEIFEEVASKSCFDNSVISEYRNELNELLLNIK